MSKYHPSSSMLRDYVCGLLSPGKDLIIKTHLTFCPECRKEVAKIEDIAGILLNNSSTDSISEKPSIEKTLDKIAKIEEKNVFNKEMSSINGGVLPRVINNYIGRTSDEISWRFRLPGIYDYQIETSNNENMYLLKVEPGARILQHTHEGEESTVILKGKMKDGDNFYSPGDISILDDNDTHNPQIIGSETCICLVVMTGKVKFTGRFTRALNLFS